MFMVLTGRLVISSLKSKRLPHWTLCGQVKHPTFALSLLRIGKKQQTKHRALVSILAQENEVQSTKQRV
jgi:hypothetical protein